MQSGILETMKILNLGTQNQENIDPNMGSNLFDHPQAKWAAYGYPLLQPFKQMPTEPTQHNMFAAYQESRDPMMTQILQQLQTMQAQVIGITLTNKQLNVLRNQGSKLQTDVANNCNPRNGLPWKRYCCQCPAKL